MKHILINYEEPSDTDLMELMKEVAIDAKNKAKMVKKQLNKTIKNEIAAIQSKLKV